MDDFFTNPLQESGTALIHYHTRENMGRAAVLAVTRVLADN